MLGPLLLLRGMFQRPHSPLRKRCSVSFIFWKSRKHSRSLEEQRSSCSSPLVRPHRGWCPSRYSVLCLQTGTETIVFVFRKCLFVTKNENKTKVTLGMSNRAFQALKDLPDLKSLLMDLYSTQHIDFNNNNSVFVQLAKTQTLRAR